MTGYSNVKGFLRLERKVGARADDDLIEDVQVIGQRGELESGDHGVEGGVLGAAVLDVETERS